MAVGSGWQSTVAYVNIGCYYVIGVPMGVLLGWIFNLGVLVLVFAFDGVRMLDQHCYEVIS